MQSEVILEQKIKKEVEQVLKELPADKMSEVLDFMLFLKKRWPEKKLISVVDQQPIPVTLHALPASNLDYLTGLVEWGGDAVIDSERFYDNG